MGWRPHHHRHESIVFCSSFIILHLSFPHARPLLSGDLATSSKVAAAAARQNVPLEVALSAAALVEKAAAAQADLVILDLSSAGLERSSGHKSASRAN